MKMAVSTKVNINKIKNTDMDIIHGLMVKFMTVDGSVANNTEGLDLLIRKEPPDLVFGKMDNE